MSGGAVLIVEDTMARWALAAARGLRAEGWRVGTASPERSVAAMSRAVSTHHVLPSLDHGVDGFARGVAEAVQREGYDVVMPASDTALLALSVRRELVGPVLPYAEHAVVRAALDKLELARAAERAGLSSPLTVPAAEALASWEGPALVKPRLRATGADGAPVELPSVFSATPAEMAAAVGEITAAGDEAVLQRPVAGRLGAMSVVIDRDGELRACVQQQALRLWPVDAGVSAYARTVAVDDALAAGVTALLRELGWVGLAQVQYLTDERGERHVIDLNGRLYGSIALAIRAGVNLPAAWASVWLGRPYRAPAARVGVTYQWLAGDLKAALAGRQRARLISVVARGLRSHHTMWAPSDPGPAARHFGRRALERLLPWTQRGSSKA